MKKNIFILLSFTLLLVSCGGGTSDLDIPQLDVENIKIDLPEKPKFNDGDIRNDEFFDYIDLYELSDFHGAVSYDQDTSETKIGLAKLSSYIKSKREFNPGGTVLLSSGDMWQGSADSNLTKGYLVTHAMNYMGFDAMELGNHEFDWNTKWIEKNRNIADFPFLCANLKEKQTSQAPSFVNPSKIIQRGNYKIGIVGTIGPVEKSIIKSAISEFTFENQNNIIQSEVKKLKDQNCDIVIWLSHYGADKLPVYVEGVNAVFGGHEHINKTLFNNGVPFLATQDYGVDIAHVELQINKITKEVKCNVDNTGVIQFKNIPQLDDEEKVKSIFNQYESETKKIKDIKIGSCSDKLTINDSLSNLCVKAMYDFANNYSKKNNLNFNCFASYHNKNGGVRSDIAKGEITYNNVYTSFPFDNEIIFVKILGKDIKQKITTNDFLAMAIYRTFDKYENFKPDDEYYYVTTDFVASNRFKVKEDDFIRTNTFVRDVVASFIKNRGNINCDNFLRNYNKEFRPVSI